MLIKQLEEEKLIKPPSFVSDSTMYLVYMGSQAYGASGPTSDYDVYGWCIPPKEMVFPHLRGEIQGFGNQIKRFDQWQKHHVYDLCSGREYDFTVYNVVKYFQFVMENNPNMIDSLFVPERCVLHITKVSELVRNNRKIFLHKGAWHKFKGYAYSSINKYKTKVRDVTKNRMDFEKKFGVSSHSQSEVIAEITVRRSNPPVAQSLEKLSDEDLDKYCDLIILENNDKRAVDTKENSYDTKYASHCVRLMNEVEQILTEGDLDLERNSDQIKSIRRGEWGLDQIDDYFKTKERELESAYTNSKLPHGPDEASIKQLLMQVLEEHYGSLSGIMPTSGGERLALLQIEEIVKKTLSQNP